MASLLTIITEDDLRRYATDTAPDDLKDEIETLVAQDEVARDKLARFRQTAEPGAHQTSGAAPPAKPATATHQPNKGADTMSKTARQKTETPEFTTREARQAVESRTSKRVLLGGLALVALIAVAVLTIGITGIGQDLNAALPSAILPDGAGAAGSAS